MEHSRHGKVDEEATPWDFDLLDGEDWYGATISGWNTDANEPGALLTPFRIIRLRKAHDQGIKTWVSFEPVLDSNVVLGVIEDFHDIFDKVKIGKLNYHPSDINWKCFGHEAERLCRQYGLDYYIKDSRELTRQEMRTLRGQALSGDADGAFKGLDIILGRKE